MDTGQIISGAAHAGLIGWLIVGGAFQSEPLPFEVTEVSVISSDAFEALLTDGPQPTVPTDVALPAEPQVEPAPVQTPPPDPDVQTTQPAPIPVPEPETAPEPPAPQPDPDVAEEAPALTPPTPPVDAPAISPTPVPRPSDRVAPEVVEAPDPEAAPDLVEREAVQTDEAAEAETPAEEQDATAREEASDQIVTEAEEPSGAPLASLRPPGSRPSRPAPAAEPATEPAADPDTAPEDTSEAVEDALRAALGGGETADIPQGPPMSAGEKDALRVAVSACWNVGSLSSEALRTTVIVGVDMEQSGKPILASIRLIGSEGGSDAAARQAYEAARRAIIRCARDGYDLPADKYGQWKEIEMTFNPERMRIK